MARIRRSTGTILALVIVALGAVVFAAVIGLLYNTFLCQDSRAQYTVDALAISLANCINRGDRVGQMNEMEERNRELVYVSRQNLEGCTRHRTQEFLSPLYSRLADEARQGHEVVEQERQHQIHDICKSIQGTARLYNNRRSDGTSLALRWLQTYEPRIVRVDVGQIVNIQSNTKSLQVIQELAQHDLSSTCIDDRTRLFKAGKNARLPAPDSDLQYRFASLPSFCQNTASPPRNTNPEVFQFYATVFDHGSEKTYAMQDIPDAVQITCEMDVHVGNDGAQQHSVRLMSTAATAGALVETK